jgi:hypothetical protein
VLPDSAAIDSARTHVGWQSVFTRQRLHPAAGRHAHQSGQHRQGFIIDKPWNTCKSTAP